MPERRAWQRGEGRSDDSPAIALAVAGLLLVFVIAGLAPRPDLPVPECRRPFERVAQAGWSVDVGCGLESGSDLRGPARLLFGLALDANAADAAALQSLPGIGPGRAGAIVAARERARFRRLEDLLTVPGIGPRTLAGLVGSLEVRVPVEECSGGVACERDGKERSERSAAGPRAGQGAQPGVR